MSVHEAIPSLDSALSMCGLDLTFLLLPKMDDAMSPIMEEIGLKEQIAEDWDWVGTDEDPTNPDAPAIDTTPTHRQSLPELYEGMVRFLPGPKSFGNPKRSASPHHRGRPIAKHIRR